MGACLLVLSSAAWAQEGKEQCDLEYLQCSFLVSDLVAQCKAMCLFEDTELTACEEGCDQQYQDGFARCDSAYASCLKSVQEKYEQCMFLASDERACCEAECLTMVDDDAPTPDCLAPCQERYDSAAAECQHILENQ